MNLMYLEGSLSILVIDISKLNPNVSHTEKALNYVAVTSYQSLFVKYHIIHM